MAYTIDEIDGIGPAYREKLTTAGIKTTDDLLDQCCTSKGRKATPNVDMIKDWIAQAQKTDPKIEY